MKFNNSLMHLCILTITLLNSQIIYGMELDGGFEPSSSPTMLTRLWGSGSAEIDRLGAQTARAMKSFADVLLKKAQDQNQQSIGRKALQVAGHCAKKIILNPKYLLLTTGIALYASPRLRNATGRFIANRYNAFATQNPNNIFVRAIAGTRSIFNFIVGGDAREQAAREQQDATREEVRTLRTQLEEARRARTTLEERLGAVTEAVNGVEAITRTLAGNVTQTREALNAHTGTVERILGEIARLTRELQTLQDSAISPFAQRLERLRETLEAHRTQLEGMRTRIDQSDEHNTTVITGLQQEVGSLVSGLARVSGNTQEILRRLAQRHPSEQKTPAKAATSTVANPLIVGRGKPVAGNGILGLLDS
jgi:DNA repair exonuclease SbcCD ATPase subunit